MFRRRLIGAALAAGLTLAGALLAGCSSGGNDRLPSGTSSAGPSGAPSASSTVATRWWSDAAAAKGSTIDPAHPQAAASKLHPDRSEYCSMLSQTIKAGKSILPGVGASDPRLLSSTEAFVGELQQVAPAAVSGQWRTLGDALIEFVKSGGTSLGSASTADLSQAAQAISLDAKKQCHVDISAG